MYKTHTIMIFESTFAVNVLEDNKLTQMILSNRKVDEKTFEKYKFKSGGNIFRSEQRRKKRKNFL